MSYSSTPPFDIIGVNSNIDYLQTLVFAGNIYVLYIDNNAPNDPLHIAIIDVPGEQLLNDTVILNTTNLPPGAFSYAATMAETAAGKIGVLVYTTSGTQDMGYLSVNTNCTISQSLNFYGITGYSFPRISKANFLVYEVIVSWVDSFGLNGAFISNTGSFDFNSLAVFNSDPLFATTGTIKRGFMVQGNATTVLALFSYQDNGTLGKLYGMILDGPFSSIIAWQVLETDVDIYPIMFPIATNKIFAAYQTDPPAPSGNFDMLTIEPISVLAFSVVDIGSFVGTYGIQLIELRNAVIPSTLDFVGSPGTVEMYRAPLYAFKDWQAGILGDEDNSYAAFYYGTIFGMVGRRISDNQNQAQIFTEETPIISGPPTLIPSWKYGVTALLCTPCAPTMYDREGNPIF